MEIQLNLYALTFNIDAYYLINITGAHTAINCFLPQSLRVFRIRHAHVKQPHQTTLQSQPAQFYHIENTDQ